MYKYILVRNHGIILYLVTLAFFLFNSYHIIIVESSLIAGKAGKIKIVLT